MYCFLGHKLQSDMNFYKFTFCVSIILFNLSLNAALKLKIHPNACLKATHNLLYLSQFFSAGFLKQKQKMHHVIDLVKKIPNFPMELTLLTTKLKGAWPGFVVRSDQINYDLFVRFKYVKNKKYGTSHITEGIEAYIHATPIKNQSNVLYSSNQLAAYDFSYYLYDSDSDNYAYNINAFLLNMINADNPPSTEDIFNLAGSIQGFTGALLESTMKIITKKVEVDTNKFVLARLQQKLKSVDSFIRPLSVNKVHYQVFLAGNSNDSVLMRKRIALPAVRINFKIDLPETDVKLKLLNQSLYPSQNNSINNIFSLIIFTDEDIVEIGSIVKYFKNNEVGEIIVKDVFHDDKVQVFLMQQGRSVQKRDDSKVMKLSDELFSSRDTNIPRGFMLQQYLENNNPEDVINLIYSYLSQPNFFDQGLISDFVEIKAVFSQDSLPVDVIISDPKSIP